MYKKIVSIIMIILLLNISMFYMNKSYASNISDIFQGAKNFMNAGNNGTQINENQLIDTSNTVYNILLVLGMSVAAIIALILGIKFMIGSVEEKAQVKDQLVPFLIGCVVIFGAFGIWQIIVSLARQL